MDVVGEKYSGVFKSLSPRSKNVGDWYFVKEGMLVLKAVVGIFFLLFLVICSQAKLLYVRFSCVKMPR